MDTPDRGPIAEGDDAAPEKDESHASDEDSDSEFDGKAVWITVLVSAIRLTVAIADAILAKVACVPAVGHSGTFSMAS